MPLAEAVAGQVTTAPQGPPEGGHVGVPASSVSSHIACSALCWLLLLQAEPTAELVKERYVAPIAAIVKEQV